MLPDTDTPTMKETELFLVTLLSYYAVKCCTVLCVQKCNFKYSNRNKFFSVIQLLDKSEGPYELRR
jgi:hypothetical protein